MELFFQKWGHHASEDSRIVLLHGMGGTGALWRPVAAQLEEEFQILAPDQRGHGKSQITPSAPRNAYSPLDYGQDIVQTLGQVQFHPTWIIGHSMGVRTACAVAYLKPQWVRGLILVDLGFYGPAGGGLGDTLANFLEELPQAFASRAEAREFMKHNSPDASIGQYLLAVATMDNQGQVSFPFDRSALIQTIHYAKDFTLRDWVQEFGKKTLPVLALRGAESRVWSREAFNVEKERFRDLSSLMFEEFPGVGHGLPFEARSAFTQRVRDFINSHSK